MRTILAAVASVLCVGAASAEPVSLQSLIAQVDGAEVALEGLIYAPRQTGQPFFIVAEGMTLYADAAVPLDDLNRMKDCVRMGETKPNDDCVASIVGVASWDGGNLFLTVTDVTFAGE